MSDEFKVDQAWAVRGIPEDVRKAVVERARGEGRTVGVWVTEALRRALAADGLADQVRKLQARIEALEGRVTELERARAGAQNPCGTGT